MQGNYDSFLAEETKRLKEDDRSQGQPDFWTQRFSAINLIKLVGEKSGLGLRESKEVVEDYLLRCEPEYLNTRDELLRELVEDTGTGSYKALERCLRNFNNIEGPGQYDFGGVVGLMLALLDNLRENAVDVDLQEISHRFTEPQVEFFLALAKYVHGDSPAGSDL